MISDKKTVINNTKVRVKVVCFFYKIWFSRFYICNL